MFVRIRNLREDSDKTQREVSEYLFCDQSLYSKYERGLRDVPVGVIIKLAELYGTSTDYILGLTDEKEKFRFINKEIQNHNFEFTEKIISDFSANWEFVGSTSIEMLLDNLDYIYENVKGKPLMILLLGSEIDYNGYNEEFDGMAAVYREINPVIEAFAEDHERIKVINPSKYIHSQDDFEDCINHFSRNVYYEIAGEICNCINEYI